MMNLDEAIKHCIEVAEELDMKAGFETDNQTYTISEVERERCKECAKEHRQIAEWLRELEQRHNYENGCQYCKYKFRSDEALSEVKADEDSD